MTSFGNPFVTRLNLFTTASPEHESTFDEFIAQANLPPEDRLQLDTRTKRFIVSCSQRPHPPSIILTGNAGDGKTYLCRQVIETFTGQPIVEWENNDLVFHKDGLALRVIKDLSEIGDVEGRSVLGDLQTSLEEQTADTVFLIAANEGRLRALLSVPELKALHQRIDQHLAKATVDDSDPLVILNLNQVTTSAYVQSTLSFFTAPRRWQVCETCAAVSMCPIRFNRDHLADPHISDRLHLLYQLLEYLEAHVTIRDMLIHLAYAITGGLTCETVITRAELLEWEPQKYVYYENVWATVAESATRSKMAVARHFQRLDVGNRARFEADDFIINGAPEHPDMRAEHTRLFSPAIDFNNRQFAQQRNDYLRGGAESPNPDVQHPLLEWLPHCRRKLYFEWQDVEKANRLIPFVFFPDYLRLIGEEQIGALSRVARDIVRGLNRAFSGLFVNMDEWLYVTSQYAHAVEQPVPVIRLKRSLDSVRLEVVRDTSEAFDRDWSVLRLKVHHPRTGEKDSISWEINLLRFEYLMRLAYGGTPNVLAEECDLSIRQFKDRLLTEFGASSEYDGEIEFFSIDRNRYVVKQLQVAEGKIRA
jgi:hypothetical protein